MAAGLAGAGCASKPELGEAAEGEDAGAVPRPIDAGLASDAGQRDARAARGDASLGIGNISVGADSLACSANLSFHPNGCLCNNAGSTASCWTGTSDRRNVGGCHDGEQECQKQGEFAVWGPCEGEVRDCPAPAEDAGVPNCGCKPGAKILCSEDCAQLIICSLTGTKTCGPDGKWGPCREEFLEGLENVSLCKNLYYGCIPGQEDGLYVGDCDSSFSCGHVPGDPPTAPPAKDPPADAGSSTPSVQ